MASLSSRAHKNRQLEQESVMVIVSMMIVSMVIVVMVIVVTVLVVMVIYYMVSSSAGSVSYCLSSVHVRTTRRCW